MSLHPLVYRGVPAVSPLLRKAFHASLAGLFGSALLTGCAGNYNPTASSTTTPVPAEAGSLHGNIHGGQQTVSGAHVYLFSASAAGYGAASTSLLSTAQPGVSSDTTGGYVTSAADGSFSISGDYACTPGTQVYAVVRGGNPGLAAGVNNGSLALMAALGTCPATGNLAASMPTIAINEVTTAASVYALRPFMTDITHVATGNSPAAIAGMANAFATVANLVDLSTGTALTTTPVSNGSNGTVATANLNMLANLLASCVDTDGTTPACAQLFASATAGTTTPTDTVTAMLNIANAPAVNVAALYALSLPQKPFAPALTVQPTDLTLSVAFHGGAINNSRIPAVDAAGNIWIPNQTGDTISVMSPLGSFVSGTSGYSVDGFLHQSPQQIAFDSNGDAVVSDYGQSGETVLGSSGAQMTSATGFNAVGFNSGDSTSGVAVDAANHVWLLDAASNMLGEFGTNGTAIAANAFGTGLLTSPTGVAIDSTGNVLVTDSGTSSVVRFNSTGAPALFSATQSAAVTGGGLHAPTSIALDHNDNIWVANVNSTLSEFDKYGNNLAGAGFTGGGLSEPLWIAVDGAGSVWVTNALGNSISHFDATGHAISPSSGYVLPGVAIGLAIDPAGSVWVTSNNAAGSSVVEFVGAATPVATPLAQGHAGVRP